MHRHSLLCSDCSILVAHGGAGAARAAGRRACRQRTCSSQRPAVCPRRKTPPRQLPSRLRAAATTPPLQSNRLPAPESTIPRRGSRRRTRPPPSGLLLRSSGGFRLDRSRQLAVHRQAPERLHVRARRLRSGCRGTAAAMMRAREACAWKTFCLEAPVSYLSPRCALINSSNK